MDQNHYIRKLEQVNEDLRRRNGELFAVLQENDLHVPLTPIDNFPTRYELLDRIVSVAVEAASNWKQYSHKDDPLIGYGLDSTLDDLQRAVDKHSNYWQHVQAERDKRALAGKKAAAARKENDLAKSA